MSKKIYIVSQLGVSNAGGVEKVSWYLQELLKEKYEVCIFTRGKLSFGKLNNLIQPFLISLKLAFIKPDFVIGNSWHCFLYPADISIHHGTSAGIIKNTGEGGMALKLTAWMEKVSAKRARKVLAVSENCKKELVELYKIPEDKIIVLNNFVQNEIFTPAAEIKKNEENKINVCFSGALCDKKGIDKLQEFSDFIEGRSFSSENGSSYQINLNIATNYERNTGAFKGRINTSLQIGLKGPEMPDFYRQNDIMFFPTRYEGFSMAALEAVSCGLPIVGTRFAVSPELEGFEFCRLIEGATPVEQIVNQIIELWEKYCSPDIKEKEVQKIHEEVKKAFGTQQYKEKLLLLIDDCMK